MAEDILDDIVRLRHRVSDAAKEHDIGRRISDQLAAVDDELVRLLEKTEARLEVLDQEGLSARTRFVSELACGLLRAIMEQRGAALGGSEVDQAVDMAAAIVRRVEERF